MSMGRTHVAVVGKKRIELTILWEPIMCQTVVIYINEVIYSPLQSTGKSTIVLILGMMKDQCSRT